MGLHVSSIAGESGARAARQNRSLRTLTGPSGRIAGRSDKISQSATGNERASRADRPGSCATVWVHVQTGRRSCLLLLTISYTSIANVKYEADPLQPAHKHRTYQHHRSILPHCWAQPVACSIYWTLCHVDLDESGKSNCTHSHYR